MNKISVIVVGRALEIQIPWRNNTSTLTILAVYAPNRPGENTTFWETVKSAYEGRNSSRPKPQFTLGDCNIVEDSIDRLPTHCDRKSAVNALKNLKRSLQMVDGWRMENPDKVAYTWSQRVQGDPEQRQQRSKS
jgi:exonuclease III